jgi:hypothetical protein
MAIVLIKQICTKRVKDIVSKIGEADGRALEIF